MRIKREGEFTYVTVLLPVKLITELRVLLADPLRGRTKYGKISHLVTHLLQGYVDQQRVVPNGQ